MIPYDHHHEEKRYLARFLVRRDLLIRPNSSKRYESGQRLCHTVAMNEPRKSEGRPIIISFAGTGILDSMEEILIYPDVNARGK